MGTHVALLRGVNVGGRNKLPMKALAALFEEAGCAEVRTYIQSGNVLFEASAAVATRAPRLVERAISERFGFEAPVVTRSASELGEVARQNPFLAAGADAKALHVAFLAKRPAPSRLSALDPQRSPPDELVARSREIYLHLPNGVARTKLTNAYLDSKLGTTSTVRNFRTVLALVALAEERV